MIGFGVESRTFSFSNLLQTFTSLCCLLSPGNGVGHCCSKRKLSDSFWLCIIFILLRQYHVAICYSFLVPLTGFPSNWGNFPPSNMAKKYFLKKKLKENLTLISMCHLLAQLCFRRFQIVSCSYVCQGIVATEIAPIYHALQEIVSLQFMTIFSQMRGLINSFLHHSWFRMPWPHCRSVHISILGQSSNQPNWTAVRPNLATRRGKGRTLLRYFEDHLQVFIIQGCGHNDQSMQTNMIGRCTGSNHMD